MSALSTDAAPDPGPRLASRLDEVRRARFVGRAAELALLRAGLLEPEPPFAVLHVFGPGGIGKSALLREYARTAASCGRRWVFLDGRNIDPSPEGFSAAARSALGAAAAGHPPADETSTAAVWLIDTFEALAPLDGWLRESFLPQLPAESIVVIAGRDPPAAAWATDLAWAGLTRIVALENLRPEESRTFLASRGIPEERHADALAFTRGHPLALALVADAWQRGDLRAGVDPRGDSDVVRILVERLIDEAPSVLHRQALELCVQARSTTEALLAVILGQPDGHALFNWLRHLSCIEQGPHGLFPHDLVREVLDADMRWRNPDAHRDLVRRLSAHYYERLPEARGAEQQRIWFDIIFLNRMNPSYRPYYVWEALGSAYAEPATVEDRETILAMVRRHQGEEAARIARHWLQRQPEAFLVYRDLSADVFGFMAHLIVQDTTAEDNAADPALPAALAFAGTRGPVRPGEVISYVRFWMHKDHYQAVSPAINLTAINASILWTTHPRLAWSFIATADPEFMEPQFTSVHVWRSPAADFEVQGRRYGVFSHDWRLEPAAAWLQNKADLALTTESALPPPRPDAAPRIVLSREAFADAVRQALRDITSRQALAANPLLQARAVAGDARVATTPADLQALLREASGSLATTPKLRKLHRAVWHTYFEPAGTQEQAAELLGLPFNTYRYQLARGIGEITDWLWRREIPGDEN